MPGSERQKQRIVILGGGFGGIYTALSLEIALKQADDFEITLVNRENYFVYQPMLAEVVSGSVGIMDTVSPIRSLLSRTTLLVRDIESVDIENRTVTLSPGIRPHPHTIEYDHLVLALGNVTDFRGMAGVHEHAMPFKNLADAIALRNHLIYVLEEANVEPDEQVRRALLTFVVAGGGFSGTEVVAEIRDFVHHVAAQYHNIRLDEVKIILLHMGNRVLEFELSERLSVYAQKQLQERGIDIRLNAMLIAATPDAAILKGGERIPTMTLVSTVPASPNPVIEAMPLPKERGRVKTDLAMQVEGRSDIWAIGDGALIPNPTGQGFCPPTAQHALRQGKVAAHNIVAAIRGGTRKEFTFKGLGKMGLLGHHKAVAELFDRIQVSGFLAWLMWRFVYWMKLPGLDRKFKVAISWFLDMLFRPDLVQLKMSHSKGIAHAHYEVGECVYREGDVGNYFYILLNGQAETTQAVNGVETLVAHLGPGECFGEKAVLNERKRSVTVRCVAPMDVLLIPKGDFGALMASLPQLRQSFDQMLDERRTRRAEKTTAPEE